MADDYPGEAPPGYQGEPGTAVYPGGPAVGYPGDYQDRDDPLEAGHSGGHPREGHGGRSRASHAGRGRRGRRGGDPAGPADGGYPGEAGYPGDGSYPADAGYPGEADHPAGGEYPGDADYPGDAGYPAGGGYPGDAGYPADGGYPDEAGYPRGPAPGRYPEEQDYQSYPEEPAALEYGSPARPYVTDQHDAVEPFAEDPPERRKPRGRRRAGPAPESFPYGPPPSGDEPR